MPNLKKLDRVAEPLITDSNLESVKILNEAQPTMFKPRLIFEPRLDVVQIL